MYGWEKPKVSKNENTDEWSVHWYYDLDFVNFTEKDLKYLLKLIKKAKTKEKDNVDKDK
tara:strand:- start:829 stop:1005 length:177 start_codon:yes stop_codon:yes gene_type:complete